jgi:hypothetical protein
VDTQKIKDETNARVEKLETITQSFKKAGV